MDESESPFEREDPVIKVILPAGQIPLGQPVTKRTGQAPYTLGDRLRLFTEGEQRKEIIAQEGTRFLIDSRGNANAISAQTELVWLAPLWALRDLIDPPEDK